MGGEIGNKFAIKLKDPAIRQKAYKSYCAFIAGGKPKEAWHYNDGEHSVCWKTMDRYIKENPEEFPSLLMQEAKAKRYMVWLEKGEKLMEGKFKNGSPVVWQTIMRNIFREIGWDKEDAKHQSDPAAIEAAARLMTQIAHAQRAQQKNAEPEPIEDTPIEIEK